MKKLLGTDFRQRFIDHSHWYFSYVEKDLEFAIEPCFSGADVAVYRLVMGGRPQLLEDKWCTNMNEEDMKDPMINSFVTTVAIAKANELYKKYLGRGGSRPTA
jgi:hypothetical protein